MNLRQLISEVIPKAYQKEELFFADRQTEKVRQMIVESVLKLRAIYGTRPGTKK